VAINCATLSENLLESELFGYEEGAFTGAKRGGKVGLFELAHKGTIFLDEINQIPIPLQAKVLRVLQERTVRRLGGDRVLPVDVRIIVASNENLREKVKEQKFRADLFYRINVLTLRLPPLRKRKGDIHLLMEHFLSYFASIYHTKPLHSQMLANYYSHYDWPGNVRELSNSVEKHTILSMETNRTSFIDNSHYSQDTEIASAAANSDSLTVKIGSLASMEKQLIDQVVKLCKGNKLQTAILLGISRSTIWNKLRETH
jgi:transcriptional regulator with PAS, ATPase and Fis domain